MTTDGGGWTLLFNLDTSDTANHELCARCWCGRGPRLALHAVKQDWQGLYLGLRFDLFGVAIPSVREPDLVIQRIQYDVQASADALPGHW